MALRRLSNVGPEDRAGPAGMVTAVLVGPGGIAVPCPGWSMASSAVWKALAWPASSLVISVNNFAAV